MLKPATKTMGGLTFEVMPFGGRKCYELGLDVAEAIFPGLALAVGALGGLDAEIPEDMQDAIEGLEGMDAGKMAEAVETLFARLPKAERWGFTMRLLEGVRVKKDQALARAMGGEDASASEGGWMPLSESLFDMIFAQNLGPVFHLIVMIVEVNWKGPLVSYLSSLSGTAARA